ncbi:beta-L-arabinofuranosidase domain-containing protein [Flavihumibacter fluvii]|uniref:beta-L-arabinofuranosidase domain-containing protein n=1 Tax=Flavihumibacter fluvii TaxID=2838157 RepID=UPI001BDF2F31|nr:beta-L-arabinofuranosidase domain-containing protein [Flavihumibacter fluvii]ULQ54741.1 glycoside hydrolase family 127 protein [Flavihumibacter fluvii]
MLKSIIYYRVIIITICLLAKENLHAQQEGTDPFEIINPLQAAFHPLPLNEIKPGGWLRDELQKNMNGFTGHLDSLVPDLILDDDIYGKYRLSKNIKSKTVGAVAEEGDWQAQYLWWNSETQSNWLDGYLRTAVLLQDKGQLLKAERIINRLLSTQDPDGYIGIYDKDLRYKFDNENGELWAKATLYRALLGWFEYKKENNILEAVEKAVQNVMKAYPINQSYPFYSQNPNAGGLTHGLAFTDVLEQLYEITKKKVYMDYCLFMYKDFSKQVLNEDAQLAKLSEINLPLKGHGVHTYEHLRSVIAAYYASGNPALKKAVSNFLSKINRVTAPSGGPAGNEFILGKTADASLGYEYCSLQELMAGWISLLGKSADNQYADHAEHLFFNAAAGNTHPTESAICYLKQDNTFYLTGGDNGDTTDKHQTRYRYSPVHKEAAVCCVPNAGRIVPYYIQNMWMKENNTLVATLLGPSEVNTIIHNKTVSIKEETTYPYENTIRFTINCNQPNTFSLKIRKPGWAVSVQSTLPYKEENGFLIFRQLWGKQTSLRVSFHTEIVKKETSNNEVYFESGPFVLCHEIKADQEITKKYSVPGLFESIYQPVQLKIYQYDKDQTLPEVTHTNTFKISMINSSTGKKDEIKLVPMAKTILRQVTFKIK